MPADSEDLQTISRRQAQSGKVSYGEPVVLHDSSRTRVVMVPFFIPRSEGTDLAVKLITYRKTAPPNDWVIVEEKSLSLGEPASRQLLRALSNHLRVADQDADGSFIVVKVTEGTAELGSSDPKAVAAALTKVLSSSEIVRHLAGAELSEQLVSAFRGAIRLSGMRSAVAKLRQHLDAGDTSEKTYQTWCERHSWAFGNAYVMRDEVRQVTPGDELDLLLPTVISGYRDIVELKRPDVPVLRWDDAHRNHYFSSEVSKAIGQAHRYLDVLHEVAAKGLRDHPEIVAYHPRAIIVIGRSREWEEAEFRALHGLNSRLSGVTVMTYDQLLAQGERLIEMMLSAPEAQSDKGTDSQEPAVGTWDDEDFTF